MSLRLRLLWMSYELAFKASALKEWEKLDSALKIQFKKKLAERLDNPHVASARLSGAPNLYKIKLRQSGYRLVYQVADEIITVTVIAVGKRERNAVYNTALSRLED